MNLKRIFPRKHKGSAMMTALFAVSIAFSFIAMGLLQMLSSAFVGEAAARVDAKARLIAEAKMEAVKATGYTSVATQPKTVYSTTDFSTEVIVSPEVDAGGGNKTKDVVVKVYRNGETSANFELPLTLSTQGSGSLPPGSIILWSGYLSAIPEGFQLCNGTNGSPDLRNRFVVGAGVDIGTHIPNGVGGIGSGYFAPGNWGGEEMHRLTIAEMPSHNHTLSAGIDTGDAGKGSYKFLSKSVPGAEPLDSSGGDQAHNIMPPYYALAYIIKL